MASAGSAVVLAALAALTLVAITLIAPRARPSPERFATGEPVGLALGVGAGLGPWRRRESGRRWCKTACGGGFSMCVDGSDSGRRGVDDVLADPDDPADIQAAVRQSIRDWGCIHGVANMACPTPALCRRRVAAMEAAAAPRAGCVTGAKATEPTFRDEVQCRYSACARCGAPAPGDTPLDQFNPVTGVGQHMDVRRSAERHARGAPLRRCSEFEPIVGRPGYMWPAPNEGALSLDAARRDARAPGLPPACAVPTVNLDTDFLTDGLFGAALLNGTTATAGGGYAAPAACRAGSGVECFASGREPADRRLGGREPADRKLGGREPFTSARRACASDLTASRVGLGSTRMDPRFRPGAVADALPSGASGRGYGTDSNAAPDTHAGGPTLGAYTPSAFTPTGVWGSAYVFGAGDWPPDACSGQRAGPPEALATGVSRF